MTINPVKNRSICLILIKGTLHSELLNDLWLYVLVVSKDNHSMELFMTAPQNIWTMTYQDNNEVNVNWKIACFGDNFPTV